MKKTGKRKIILLAVLALCIMVLAAVLLQLRSWLHSDGMHFIGKYGQVHLSYMCEGIDQDGNAVEAKNITVDGTISHSNKFEGDIHIENLPELEKYGLFPGGGGGVWEIGSGVYQILGYTFLAASSSIREKWDEEEEWDELSFADIWCTAEVWLKDNQFVLKFVQGEKDDEYYIFYSDKEMLDIPVIQEKVKK